MSKVKFEIYKGYNKRKKTYIVARLDATTSTAGLADELMNTAKKYFRCSEEHVKIWSGYLYKGELYLEDPQKSSAECVYVAWYVSNKCSG